MFRLVCCFAFRDNRCMFAKEKTSYVFLSHRELRRQRSPGCRRRRHLDQGEAPARTAFRSAPRAIRRSSVYRGIRLAGIGWDSFACRGARHGSGVHALCARTPPLFAAAQRASVRAECEEPQQDVAVPRSWRSNYALYFVGADGIPITAVCQRKQYRIHKSSHQQHSGCGALCDCNLWLTVFFEDQDDGNLRRGKPGDTAGCNGGQAIRVHVVMVCVRGGCKCDHPPLLLEKPERAAVPVCLGRLSRSEMDDLSRPWSPVLEKHVGKSA